MAAYVSEFWQTSPFLAGLLLCAFGGLACYSLASVVRWAKKMPKGAFLFLALFPLISIFPIPPLAFKDLEKLKQEQSKENQESGDKHNGDSV